jgi:predicted nucleic acid-binding protein
MSAAVDTSALIAFSSIGRIDLLLGCVGEVLIPDAVYREIVTQGIGWRNALEAQQRLAEGEGLRRVSVKASELRSQFPALGNGEREVLALGRVRKCLLVIDDLRGRKAALALGMDGNLTGSLGILLKAKRTGQVPAIAPLIRKIQERQIYYASNLVASVLKEVGE